MTLHVATCLASKQVMEEKGCRAGILHAVVRIRADFDPRCQRRKQVVLVLDKSASMEYRLGKSKNAMKIIIDRLMSDDDQVAIVDFDGNPHVIHMSSLTDKERIKQAIDAIKLGGSTNIQAALEEAFGQLAACPEDPNGCTRFVFLLSDGQHNSIEKPMNYAKLEELQRETNCAGVFALGIGTDFDFTQLRNISDRTKGQMCMLKGGETLEQELVDHLAHCFGGLSGIVATGTTLRLQKTEMLGEIQYRDYCTNFRENEPELRRLFIGPVIGGQRIHLTVGVALTEDALATGRAGVLTMEYTDVRTGNQVVVEQPLLVPGGAGFLSGPTPGEEVVYLECRGRSPSQRSSRLVDPSEPQSVDVEAGHTTLVCVGPRDFVEVRDSAHCRLRREPQPVAGMGPCLALDLGPGGSYFLRTDMFGAVLRQGQHGALTLLLTRITPQEPEQVTRAMVVGWEDRPRTVACLTGQLQVALQAAGDSASSLLSVPEWHELTLLQPAGLEHQAALGLGTLLPLVPQELSGVTLLEALQSDAVQQELLTDAQGNQVDVRHGLQEIEQAQAALRGCMPVAIIVARIREAVERSFAFNFEKRFRRQRRMANETLPVPSSVALEDALAVSGPPTAPRMAR
jgi:uncharacterized protein YegL